MYFPEWPSVVISHSEQSMQFFHSLEWLNHLHTGLEVQSASHFAGVSASPSGVSPFGSSPPVPRQQLPPLEILV